MTSLQMRQQLVPGLPRLGRRFSVCPIIFSPYFVNRTLSSNLIKQDDRQVFSVIIYSEDTEMAIQSSSLIK